MVINFVISYIFNRIWALIFAFLYKLIEEHIIKPILHRNNGQSNSQINSTTSDFPNNPESLRGDRQNNFIENKSKCQSASNSSQHLSENSFTQSSSSAECARGEQCNNYNIKKRSKTNFIRDNNEFNYNRDSGNSKGCFNLGAKSGEERFTNSINEPVQGTFDEQNYRPQDQQTRFKKTFPKNKRGGFDYSRGGVNVNARGGRGGRRYEDVTTQSRVDINCGTIESRRSMKYNETAHPQTLFKNKTQLSYNSGFSEVEGSENVCKSAYNASQAMIGVKPTYRQQDNFCEGNVSYPIPPPPNQSAGSYPIPPPPNQSAGSYPIPPPPNQSAGCVFSNNYNREKDHVNGRGDRSTVLRQDNYFRENNNFSGGYPPTQGMAYGFKNAEERKWSDGDYRGTAVLRQQDNRFEGNVKYSRGPPQDVGYGFTNAHNGRNGSVSGRDDHRPTVLKQQANQFRENEKYLGGPPATQGMGYGLTHANNGGKGKNSGRDNYKSTVLRQQDNHFGGNLSCAGEPSANKFMEHNFANFNNVGKEEIVDRENSRPDFRRQQSFYSRLPFVTEGVEDCSKTSYNTGQEMIGDLNINRSNVQKNEGNFGRGTGKFNRTGSRKGGRFNGSRRGNNRID